MGKILLAVSAVALISAITPASAADFMAPVIDAPALEAFNGFYAGISLGVVGQSGQVDDVNANYSTVEGWQDVTDAAGFLLGGQIGYDFSLSDNLVIGLAVDGKSVSTETSFCTDSDCNEGPDDVHLGYEITSLFAVTGRIGFVLNDSALLYALVGPAAGVVNTHHWDNSDYDNTNRIFTGYTVGVGAEMLVSESASVGIEGRYYDLGSQTWTDNADEDFGAAPTAYTVSLTANMRF